MNDVPRSYVAFEPILRRMDPDGILNAEEKVRSLLAHPGWEIVVELIQRRAAGLKDLVIHAPELDPQKALRQANAVGVVAGLEQAAEAPVTFLHAVERVREWRAGMEAAEAAREASR